MAKISRHLLTRFYRIILLFFGFLFLLISGCKPRSAENTNDATVTDTSSTDDDWMLAPEYGAREEDWMEIPVEEEDVKEVKNPDKKVTDNKDQTPKTTEQQVPQHVPGPMEPATAYGTNYQQYNTSIDSITPQE
jgi:hypothetical protein